MYTKLLRYALVLGLVPLTTLASQQRPVRELALIQAQVGRVLMGFTGDQAAQTARYPWDSFESLEKLLDQYRAIDPQQEVVAFDDTVKRLVQEHWFQSVGRRMRIHQYLQKIFAEHVIHCSGTAVPRDVAQFYGNLSSQEQRMLVMNILRAIDYAGA